MWPASPQLHCISIGEICSANSSLSLPTAGEVPSRSSVGNDFAIRSAEVIASICSDVIATIPSIAVSFSAGSNGVPLSTAR